MPEMITVTSEYLREKEEVLQDLLEKANIEFGEVIESMQGFDACFHAEIMKEVKRQLEKLNDTGGQLFKQIGYTTSKLSMIASIYETTEKENINV